MSKRIYLASPHMCGEEMKYVNEAFDTNWIAPLGRNVDCFESEIAEYVGGGYGAAMSSGTAAIHLGLKWLGVTEGDYVFCSTLTFAGACNPIVYLNAKPIFIDSEYESWNFSAKALEKAYEKYPNPKAIVVVNLYGQSADFDAIRAVSNKHGTPILEDAAESLGSMYKGKHNGTMGDVGIFSFNGNKIITTSGGGMAVCKDEIAIKKLRYWSTQSRQPAPYYEHTEIGYNYRMSNICAGIGRGQLHAIDDRIVKKKQIYEYYKKAFADIDQIEMMPIAQYGSPNYWLSVATMEKGCPVLPQDIITALAAENIESRRIWKPMHMQPVFAGHEFFTTEDGISCTEDLFNRGVCLPSDTKMIEADIARVVACVKKLF